MRSIADPFVVRLPAGARVRTRLRLTTADEAVLRAVGAHLGSLAGHDLAWRCRQGRSDNQWTVRKRAATSQSSSRWAGTITRVSNDQWQRGLINLANHQIGLRRAARSIRTRLAVPVGASRAMSTGTQPKRSDTPSSGGCSIWKPSWPELRTGCVPLAYRCVGVATGWPSSAIALPMPTSN